MTTIPTLTLNDGLALPQVGYGTWPMDDAQARVSVAEALRAGYRLIDTASRYGNEHGVGLGLRDSGIARSEVLLTSKLGSADQGYDAALRGFEATLARLGTDYLDLYLIHWPLPQLDRYVDSWKALVKLKQEGRVRSIGVSNFTPAQIERIERETGVLPSVNQVELHPRFNQKPLRQWLAGRGIAVESWSPLGRGEVLRLPVLEALAAKHRRSVAQVVLRWHVQLGLVAIPKSQDPRRIEQNLALFDFALDADDMATLDSLETGQRQGGDPDTHFE